jgi:hypothetical protein
MTAGSKLSLTAIGSRAFNECFANAARNWRTQDGKEFLFAR